MFSSLTIPQGKLIDIRTLKNERREIKQKGFSHPYAVYVLEKFAMTGSIMPPNSIDGVPQGVGVAPENEGVVLQRGGEELLLEKVDDRFTVRPIADRSLNELAQQIGAGQMQVIPSLQLVEFQVDPTQLDQAMQTARASGLVEFASHVYRLQNSPVTSIYLTDEVTVQFSGQVDTSMVEAIATSLGLEQVKPVEGVPQAIVFRVTGQAPANPIKLANQLMRRSEVLVAEPNVAVGRQPLYRPRDPEYPKQWYLNHNGGSNLAAGSHIFAEAAWDITRGVRSVIVAVTDDGFDLSHPDFQGKNKIVSPRDLKQRDATPQPESPHENHGTACAGLAIAEENNIGIVGVAPGCSFMPIRTSGFLDDNSVEAMFGWAIEHGASVISCSWGSSQVNYALTLRQRAVITRAATQGRNGKGCVVVFAAGNANRPVNGNVNEQGWVEEVLAGSTTWLNGFAVHPDVIAVSASTSLGKKAAYSNWGSTISVCAPSNNAPPGMWFQQKGYVNTAPAIRVALAGKGVFSSDRVGAAGYDPGSFTGEFGGTSSACPLVAGVAALVLSANPSLTAKEVKQILQETADKILDPDPDPQLNLRRGTYDGNGHSQWFGYGKVNAFKAVRAAQQGVKTAEPQRIPHQNTTVVAIPDFNLQGTVSMIQVTNPGLIRGLEVAVDVEHSFMGDLEISLISPQGETVLLQSRTLGRLTRLRRTYSLQDTPLLGRFLGKTASGRWQLRLVDFAQLNTGSLRSWQLNLTV